MVLDGGPAENRTRTPVKVQVFETCASTNSATGPRGTIPSIEPFTSPFFWINAVNYFNLRRSATIENGLWNTKVSSRASI